MNRDTILLASSSNAARAFVADSLKNNFNLLEASNLSQAVLLLRQCQASVTMVILDAANEPLFWKDMLDELANNEALSAIPSLVLVSGKAEEPEREALEHGACDVLVLPCSSTMLLHRARTGAKLFLLQCRLEEQINGQERQLRESNQAMVDALSSIIEYRSVESGQHIQRVSQFTQILLTEVAQVYPEYHLDEDTIQLISGAAAFHDIGKIAIPDSILKKDAPLNKEEWKQMRMHPLVGCHILETFKIPGGADYLQYAYHICRYHHERWDGNGYPEGLAGDDIPLCAQVVGLADVYDALTNKRCYKPAIPHEQAVNMILNSECGVFSPQLLECFKQVVPQLAVKNREYSDGHCPPISVIPPLTAPQQGNDPNSFEAMQAKYNVLLHLLDATVVEVDYDASIYHILYNPDATLAPLMNLSFSPFTQATQIVKHQLIVPEEWDKADALIQQDLPVFFAKRFYRQSFLFHIVSPTGGAPVPYELTLLRIDPAVSHGRHILLVWKRLEHQEPPTKLQPSQFHEFLLDQAIYQTMGSIYMVQRDCFLTLCKPLRNLALMLCYTEQELMETFSGRLIELVHPKDRQALIADINKQLDISSEIQTEFRLLHKDGHYLWVMNRSHLSRDADGMEYLRGILTDISQRKASELKLRRSIEKHEIILSQIQNAVFEYDYATNTIEISSKWKDIFGYDPLNNQENQHINPLDILSNNTYLHPDDVPLLRQKLETLEQSGSYTEAKARIVKIDGHYLWCQLRVSLLRSPDQQPQKLVGVIVNIDESERALNTLKKEGSEDKLTGLLNKSAAQQAVQSYLESASQDTTSAMILIDLDNFKMVNDQYGHLFGDVVLSQCALEIQRQFRTEDVIARIGGDEFLVFMKTIPSQKLFAQRLHMLTDSFQNTFFKHLPENKLTCSVGAALFPTHGTTYQDLFVRADEAMYYVKGHGKGGYFIYNGQELGFLENSQGRLRTAPIDSDTQQSLSRENLVAYAFNRMYESDDLYTSIRDLIEIVGRQLNVSRAYIFENNQENTICKNTFAWCGTGISPVLNSLQQCDVFEYYRHFDEHGLFCCSDISQLEEPVRSLMESQSIRSVLQCAIYENGIFRGFVGFDECIAKRTWSAQQLEMVSAFAKILSVFLLCGRRHDAAVRLSADLTAMLDNQQLCLYVIDPNTLTLKFLNSKVRQAYPQANEGMFCYEALMNRSQQCIDCPFHDLVEGTLQVSPCPTCNGNFTLTPIRWDGDRAYMFSSPSACPRNSKAPVSSNKCTPPSF